MTACKNARVKRVVMTSTSTTITGSLPDDTEGKVYTEEDEAEADKISNLNHKVNLAVERAALDFDKENESDDKVQVAILNPQYSVGPILLPHQAGREDANVTFIKHLLKSKSFVGVPKIYVYVVDVRDLVKLVVKALNSNAAVGSRHIVASKGMFLNEVSQVISKEFKTQGYSVPTSNSPLFLLKAKGLFNKNTKNDVLPRVGKVWKMESQKMKDLEFEPEPENIEEAIKLMCYSLIDMEYVKKAKKYQGPNRSKSTDEKGETNGATNGDANGETNGEANGETNGEANGEANGTANGEATTNGNGKPKPNESDKPAAENGESTPAATKTEEKAAEEPKVEAPKTEEKPAEVAKEEPKIEVEETKAVPAEEPKAAETTSEENNAGEAQQTE
ncbi:DgyrCDS10254 [Dimorphilus gyrociliatus]|uniref:DgyrCDS10254 n=1 Tax=Dimorphilus gyrociliatus TaxID=2664684 RepID=A0A7I8W0T7_9ANNE|nr:DgyrCDS10254 [Dimorphilus gyrociliatus]